VAPRAEPPALRSAELAVPPTLRPFVARAWWVERHGPPATHDHTVSAGLDATLLFKVDDGPATRSRLYVVGPRSRAVVVPMGGTPLTLGLSLRPGAVRPLLGPAARELADGRVGLEALWGTPGEALHERLASAASIDARVGLLAAELERRAGAASAPDPRVVYALRALERAGGALGVEELAEAVALSPRQLRRLFVDAIGLGPKVAARLARVRALTASAARLASRPGGPSWAALAVEHGFSDQAHLTRELRALRGTTPGRSVADSFKTAGSARR